MVLPPELIRELDWNMRYEGLASFHEVVGVGNAEMIIFFL